MSKKQQPVAQKERVTHTDRPDGVFVDGVPVQAPPPPADPVPPAEIIESEG